MMRPRKPCSVCRQRHDSLEYTGACHGCGRGNPALSADNDMIHYNVQVHVKDSAEGTLLCLQKACAQMQAGAFKCKCKCKRRIKCKFKCKCTASESNASENENVQQLNQMQIQMLLDQMQMHLDHIQIHLDQMQMLFYDYVFLRLASDILLNYLVVKDAAEVTLLCLQAVT